METPAKTPRKRVANFTRYEKALLARLIKGKPIIETKLTDGKSIAKKQVAWKMVTREFNSHSNVHKREINTLKKAWDNMKAWTRKAHSTEIRPGPQPPEPTSQDWAIMRMIEDAAPTISEMKNSFNLDNDRLFKEEILSEEDSTSAVPEYPEIILTPVDTDQNGSKYLDTSNSDGHSCEPSDYSHQEAVLRIKHLQNKRIMFTQLQTVKLEVEEIKKRAALLEEERNKILLEKAQLELEILKNSLS